jgi:hypothetical protein
VTSWGRRRRIKRGRKRARRKLGRIDSGILYCCYGHDREEQGGGIARREEEK